MRVLTIATIFPNPAQPLHGLFVQRRVQAQARLTPHHVVSPVPAFPLASYLPRYAYRRHIPERDPDSVPEVDFPRFLSVPALLKPLDGPFMAWSLLRWIRQTRFHPDVIDAHLGFPDGDAARRLARRLGVPFGVTLRGVDINVLPERYPVRRRLLQRVLREANAVFSVSDSLRARAIELGARPERTETVYNGVDARLFQPGDQKAARRNCDLPSDERIVLSVGHLCARKRFHTLIEALSLSEARDQTRFLLVIVGGAGAEGNVRSELERRAEELGVRHRVIFAGAQPPAMLPQWYRAADVFALASEVEGRPNAVLEALACGLPVVAVRCWGLPELVRSEEHGFLVPDGSPATFAQAIGAALSRPWNAVEIARHAHRFTWDAAALRVVQRYRQCFGG